MKNLIARRQNKSIVFPMTFGDLDLWPFVISSYVDRTLQTSQQLQLALIFGRIVVVLTYKYYNLSRTTNRKVKL